MGCLNLIEGGFSSSGSTGDGNLQVTRSSLSLAVSKIGGGYSEVFSPDSLFMIVGNSYLLILDKQSNINEITRSVSVIDGTSLLKIKTVVWRYNTALGIEDSVMYFSAGNNAAFMAVTSHVSPNRRQLHGFFRSDTGIEIASLGFAETDEPESIETIINSGNLQAFYESSWKTAGPLPQGECDVNPSSQTFDDVISGPGADTSLVYGMKQFTLKNDGNQLLLYLKAS